MLIVRLEPGADLQARLALLSGRLRASAVVQEGDKPPEDPERLLAELDALSGELESLIAAINHTNAASTLPGGMTVTAALARRDVLARERRELDTAIQGHNWTTDLIEE